MYVYLIYIYMYIYTYIHTYMCIYMCIYIYTCITYKFICKSSENSYYAKSNSLKSIKGKKNYSLSI